ncbi:hypothetical protein ACLOJK_030484 [Asimina triloba]
MPARDFQFVVSEVVAGSAAWIGRGLSCVCAQRRENDARSSLDLTPLQEECLQRLQNRIEVNYDGSNPEHQEALRALWYAAFPEEELQGLISEQWKEMGWQGKDPSTDFRGGGFISLENLLFFARNFPESETSIPLQKTFQELLQKSEGDRAMWEYPFAVAGVNITFMLIQMLELQAGSVTKPCCKSGTSLARANQNSGTASILSLPPWRHVTFHAKVREWVANPKIKVSANGGNDTLISMRFLASSNMVHQLDMTVMKATRRQLERELLLEDITRLEDMPSYSLLLRLPERLTRWFHLTDAASKVHPLLPVGEPSIEFKKAKSQSMHETGGLVSVH